MRHHRAQPLVHLRQAKGPFPRALTPSSPRQRLSDFVAERAEIGTPSDRSRLVQHAGEECLGPLLAPPEMAGPQIENLTCVVGQFGAVLPDRLRRPVAGDTRTRIGAHEALVNETGKPGGDRLGRQWCPSRDHGYRFCREGRCKHRHAPQQCPVEGV